jgi:hypothetical protein
MNVRAKLGTTFSKPNKMKGSILKSGVLILEGIKDKEEAEQVYNEIIKT